MKQLKHTLLYGWHLMRWVRLILGLFFAVMAVGQKDTFMGLAAGFLLLTALANIGCCGTAGCAMPVQKPGEKQPEKIEFEEIKNA